MKPKLSIILPTFNESGSISELIQEIFKVCQNTAIEVVVVDDDSPDHTAEVVTNAFKNDNRVKVFVRQNVNKSLGSSILYGILHSSGEIIVGMDADFNHPPALIPKLVTGLNGADLVVASRFVSSVSLKYKLTQLGSYLFNALLKYGFRFPIWDNSSGFYAIKRVRLLQLPLTAIYANTYGEYHLRLVYLARQKGYQLNEVPVIYGVRRSGQSKSVYFKMLVKYLFEAIKLTAV